jgi:DNA sulfur modification protein DndC
MEGLIDSGETWLLELKDFRNKLYESTIPANKEKYRNYKRRTGKAQYARKAIDDDTDTAVKTIPGPYWMKQRQEWLRELLTIERDLNAKGRKITLIQPEELYAIRREWMLDPNEPAGAHALPKIYFEIYNKNIDWPVA